MKTHSLVQGSDLWHAHRRAGYFNASDCAAMMGVSPYETRTQLLHRLATGITPEVDAGTQRLFDRGHALEAFARPLAEAIVGEDLYPVTGTNERYSASFDGLKMDESLLWECKTLNDALRAAMPSGGPHDGVRLPPVYIMQLEHQSIVSDAAKGLFTATDGKDDTRHCWFYPDPQTRERIIAGWAQFAADLATYKPEPAPVEVIGHTPETLPALRIEVTGMVTASNLEMFREHALTVFGGINRTLVTDQDFATAKTTVKWCGEVETRLAAAKQHALSQTESIDALFRTIDTISEEARKVRLELDKLVTRREVEVKTEMVGKARAAYVAHEAALRAETGAWILLLAPDFAGAIKGKRSLALMQDALDTALANAKIAADASARKIRANLACIETDGAGFDFLFSDWPALIAHPLEHLQLLIQSRIAKHKEAEAAKEEATRIRIRAEERAGAEREAREKMEREQADAANAAKIEAARMQREQTEQLQAQRIRSEEQAKAQAPVIVAPVAIELVAKQAQASQDSAPTLKLGAISERLGFTLTEAFLRTLGFEFAALDRTSKLYHESDFPLICDALMEHIAYVQTKY